jgi:uncharacterized protein YndB with AHSA1/START domain
MGAYARNCREAITLRMIKSSSGFFNIHKPKKSQYIRNVLMSVMIELTEKKGGNSLDKTNSKITVKTTVNAPVEKVWESWTAPEHITKWNNASDDWHTPFAENELTVGGKFRYRMEAKDGSFGFDFTGIYDEVQPHKNIAFTLDDGRKVEVTFVGADNSTEIIETFEAESQNSIELQQKGWQAILDNFKKYTEGTV